MDIKYTTDEQIEAMRRKLRTAGEGHGKRRTKKIKGSGRLARWIKLLTGTLFTVTVVILVFVLFWVLSVKEKGETPSVLGYRLYIIETGSMSPTLDTGAIIITKEPKNKKGLVKDDIVTFNAKGGQVVTHRIIEVIKDEKGNVRYRTKGDNPINSPDVDLLDPERVIAIFVARVPFT